MRVDIPEEILDDVEMYMAMEINDGQFYRTIEDHNHRLNEMTRLQYHIGDYVLAILKREIKKM